LLAGSKHSQYLRIWPIEYLASPVLAGGNRKRERGKIHSPLYPLPEGFSMEFPMLACREKEGKWRRKIAL
jgi:hypothetical protein